MQYLNREAGFSGRVQRAGRQFGYFAAVIALYVVTAGSVASGATITVNPGQSIQSGINAAAAGDTVNVSAGTYTGGIALNKAVSVVAIGAVTVNATSPRSGIAVNVTASDASVTGIVFLDFGQAISTDANSPRTRVKFEKCVFRRSGSAWIVGSRFTFDGCEFDRPTVNGSPAGDGDYMGLYGDGHTLRRCYFHGLNLNSDMPPGAHNDGIQTFTEGGYSWQRLSNLLVDECIFADYVQGIWISNNAGIANAISNITITDSVFWGQEFTVAGADYWSAHGTAFQSAIPGIVLKNNLYRKMWNNVSLYSVPGPLTVEGNIFIDTGNVYSRSGTSSINRGATGNIIWNAQTSSLLSPLAPDRTNVNPQVQNPNAKTGAEVIGPDGIPWTADDAWRPMNTTAAAYGPQIVAGGTAPDVTPPVITLNGVTPMTVVQGSVYTEPAAMALDDRDGEVIVTITGTVNTTVVGTYTRTYTARDTAGNTATKTRTINVVASTGNTPPTISLSGPTSAIQLAAGATQATFVIAANAADAQGAVTLLWTLPSGTATTQQVTVTQSAGTVTYSCRATDAGGLTATASIAITVLAAPTSGVVKQWVRVRSYDASGVMTGYAWVSGTTQTAQPTSPP